MRSRPSSQTRSALFRDSGRFYRDADEMFALTSWVQVMIGQRIVPTGYHPLVDVVPERELVQLADSVRGVIASCVAAMPDARAIHRALLQGAGGRMSAQRRAQHARRPVRVGRALLVGACKTPPREARPGDRARRAGRAGQARSIRCSRTSRSAPSISSGKPPSPRPASCPIAGPSRRSASIAAVGFALNAYAIGAERGYVTRAQARARVLTTLRFLRDAPQGTDAATSRRLPGLLLSLPQFRHRQALRQLRAIHRRHRAAHGRRAVRRRLLRQDDRRGSRDPQARGRAVPARELALVHRARARHPHGLEPGAAVRRSTTGAATTRRMLVYMLALGSPTYPAAREHLGRLDVRLLPALGHARGPDPPHLRPHVRPPVQRTSGSTSAASRTSSCGRRASTTSRTAGARCWRSAPTRSAIRSTGAATAPTSGDSPPATAPATSSCPTSARQRQFRSYAARGVGPRDETFDDGTIAPTAVHRLAALRARGRVARGARDAQAIRPHIYGKYGFVDAFNPSFDYDVPLRHGRRVRGMGWVATDYLGIDQGPIISMIENYRSELIWTVMKRNRVHARRPEARRIRRRLAGLKHRLHVLVRVVRLAIAAALLPLRELDLLAAQRLVRNLLEEVMITLRRARLLSSVRHDVPRRACGDRWPRTCRRAPASSRTSGCRT